MLFTQVRRVNRNSIFFFQPGTNEAFHHNTLTISEEKGRGGGGTGREEMTSVSSTAVS